MIPKKNREIVYKNFEKPSGDYKTLRIIHFNDVYNIENGKQEPVGGAARFKTVIDELNKKKNHFVFFSGDAFSPSTLSLFAKGEQMVEVLNKFGIHAAVLGNHEFDMGLDTAIKLVNKSNFPWLLSNLFDIDTKMPIFNYETKVVYSTKGLKIGIIGLVEKEWVCSLPAIDYDDVLFEPFIEMGNKLAKDLKTKENVDFVIALTHMRWANDEKLAKKAPEIDLILGGHDHDYDLKKVNNRWIIKSGSDFKELSVIEFLVSNGKKDLNLKKIEKIKIDSEIPENQEIKKIVDYYLADADRCLDEELGVVNKPLDGRYNVVRVQESNLGNFLCDIIMCSLNVDCAILNGGSLRSDQIHPAGVFKRRDLRNILPFDSELVAVNITGKQLHEVLEHGVAKYHDVGGRYPQVSGIFFAFDPNKPPNNRVDASLVKIQDEYLDLNRTYRLATNTFLKSVDDTLKDCPVAIQSENIPFLYTLVENHFKQIKDRQRGINNKEDSVKGSPLIPRVLISCIVKDLSKDPEVLPKKQTPTEQSKKRMSFRFVAQIVLETLKQRKVLLSKEKRIIRQSQKFKTRMQELEQKSLKLAPEVEGRSRLIDNQTHQQLLNERKLYEINLKNSENSNDNISFYNGNNN